MAEPTYEYIKGQGWVVKPPETYVIAIDQDGVLVRVYNRKPKDGEGLMVCYALPHKWWDHVKDQPNYGAVIEHIARHSLEHFGPFETGGQYDRPDARYLTLVPND